MPRLHRCDLGQPNKHEAERLAGREITDEDDFEAVGSHLADALRGTAVVITRGDMGMALFREGQESIRVIGAPRSLYDATGAGDTVISTMAASLAAGTSIETAVCIANRAAAIVITKRGTATVSAAELRERFR
jgi:rfaE bifunctional protein kinase chain/domain